MHKLIQILLFWMFLFLGACSGDPGYHVENYKVEKFEDIPEDIKVPGKTWDLLEFKKIGEEHSGPSDHPQPTKNVVFAAVKVFLVQKTEGVVAGEAVKVELPSGGGTIDLSRYITDQRGTFYVGFEFSGFENAKDKKVLFVSRTRKRKIGDQIYGAGCNQFFDISDRFFKAMKAEGLKVNTTQQRYVSVLGGTYLFAAQMEKEIQVAQVTFTNSQYSKLFCEEQ